MSCLIWIIGKSGSGKTSLCKELIKLLPTHFVYLNIDHLRLKHNPKHNTKGESVARGLMEEALETEKFVLLESIGTYGKTHMNRFDKVIKIELNAPDPLCKRRIKNRVNDPSEPVIPFPYSGNSKPERINSLCAGLKYYHKLFNGKANFFDHRITVANKAKAEILAEVIEILKTNQFIK